MAKKDPGNGDGNQPKRKKKTPQGFLKRPKPRRWRRSVVSIDEGLIAASSRIAPFQPSQPLVKGLSLPLCIPTIVAPPIGGKPLITRLEPQDVLRAHLSDQVLICILLGFAQTRPTGVKKVALTRQPSQDVVVRLFQDLGNGVIHPTWILAQKHRDVSGGEELSHEPTGESTANEEIPGLEDDNLFNDFEDDALGIKFCQYVEQAIAPMLYMANKKSMSERILACVKFLTGRTLKDISLHDTNQAWEKILGTVCNKKPVFSSSKELGSKTKNRKYPPGTPLVILDAFEMGGERYVYVFSPHPEEEGMEPMPKDITFQEFLHEAGTTFAVG